MNLKATWALIAGGAVSVLLLSAAQNQKTPPQETTRLIDSIQGPALYKAYCAACHGPSGTGNGPMAKSVKVPPADLTSIAARNGGKFPRMRMERIILGEAGVPEHGTREMPLWGPIFSQVTSDQDLGRIRVDNLARYIEGMQKK